MPGFIHQFTQQVTGEDGVRYSILACGESRSDGTWEGWIENPYLWTVRILNYELSARLLSQTNLQVGTWASGLETIYFEGAFARAAIR